MFVLFQKVWRNYSCWEGGEKQSWAEVRSAVEQMQGVGRPPDRRYFEQFSDASATATPPLGVKV